MDIRLSHNGKEQDMNAFTRRPVFTQIIAYSIVTAQFLIFTICILPNIIKMNNRIVLAIFYYLSFVIMIITWIITSKINPTDSLLYLKRTQIEPHFSEGLLLYCQKCRSIVKQGSLHCKICNTCIEEFDHHCIWINNCIGKKNYNFFISMIISITINFLMFLGGTCMIWFDGDWRNYLISMVVCWIISVIVFVFTFLLIGLVIFHFYLMAIGKTTFNYLMEKKMPQVSPIFNQPEFITENNQIAKQKNRSIGSEVQINNNAANILQYDLAMNEDGISIEKNKNSQNHDHKSINQMKESKQNEHVEQQAQSRRSETKSNVSLYLRNRSSELLIGQLEVEESSHPLESKYKSLNMKGKKKTNLIKLQPLKV